MNDFRKVGFIVNPSAGGGSGGRKWTQVLQPKCIELFGKEREALPRSVDQEWGWTKFMTGKQGDSVRFVEQLMDIGCNVIVCVGGDGTLNEVVHGYISAGGKERGVALGIISAGTGGDFPRTIGTKEWNLSLQLDLIAHGPIVDLDAGRLECYNSDGKEDTVMGASLEELRSGGKFAPSSPLPNTTRYFINISSCGISGAVVEAVESSQSKGWGGGLFTFLVPFVKTGLLWNNQPMRWRMAMDDPWIEEDGIFAIVVCNGRVFGGGMLVGPTASPTDGLFDVVVFRDMSGIWDVNILRKLYSGRHLDGSHSPRVQLYRTTELFVEYYDDDDSDDEDGGVGGSNLNVTCPVESDGELPGALPARWSIMSGAVRFVVPTDFAEQHAVTSSNDS